jgi:hypothetical protein
MPDFHSENISAMLFKKESVEGTDSVPEVGTNALQIIDGTASIQANTQERSTNRTFDSANAYYRTNKRFVMTGGFEVIGAANAGEAAPISDLLQCLGHAEILHPGPPAYTAYNAITDGVPSGTCNFYHNGELMVGLGSRGRINTLSGGIDQVVQATFELVGVPVVSETGIPAGVDTSAQQQPISASVESLTVTLAGVPLLLRTFTFNYSGSTALIEHSEGRTVRSTGRAITGTLTVFRPSQSELDIRQLVEDHTLQELVINQHLSNAPAKSIILTADQVQLGDPTNSAYEGLRTWDIPVTVIGTEANQGLSIQLGQ